MSTVNPSRQPDAATAGMEVLAWLHAPERNPLFLKELTGPVPLEIADEIVQRFLGWVQPCGFALELVNNGTPEKPAWAGHWSHLGNQLVGFEQPGHESDPRAARLVSCAALLRNHWCRQRLT